MRYRNWFAFMLFVGGAIAGMVATITSSETWEALLGYALFIINGATAGDYITRKWRQS